MQHPFFFDKLKIISYIKMWGKEKGIREHGYRTELNEWHQEAARKPYVRVGVTLLSGALILMSAQEIVSLYLEKNLIPEIEVCATTEDINVSGNDLPEKVTITKQIKEPEKMDEHSFLSAETIQTDVNQADVIQVAAVPAEILVEEPMVEEIAVEKPVVEEIVAEKPGVKRDTTINVASEPVITNPDSMENVKKMKMRMKKGR